MSDLIDRQAAIELILSGKVDDDSPEWVGVECPEECNSFLEWAAEEVGKMPSAERKKGKWKRAYLDHEAMGERPSILYCSVCNQCIAYPVNYCPNCGAEMENSDEL